MLNKFCVDASKNSMLEYIQYLLCLGEIDMNKKKLTVFGLIWCLLVMCLVVVGCDNLLNDKKDDETGIDYESYSDYALIVKNNAQKNMVLFKGEPSANQLLGGVRAGSTTKLKNNTSIFSESTDYVVYVVTEENYNAHKDNLSVLNNSPYCTFYAVYNKGMINTNTYQISSMLNGEYSITINNGTNYNVEIRNKSSKGETLAFVLANTYEQKFYLEEGNYLIFPVFRKYDKRAGVILDNYPTYSKDAAELSVRNKPKSFKLGLVGDTKNLEFNVSNWSQGLVFKPSAAYIQIINEADQAMQFYRSANSAPMTNSAGVNIINDGDFLIYSIDMTDLGGGEYRESEKVAGLRLGQGQVNYIYLHGDASTEVAYKAGYLYSYKIQGDPEVGYTIIPTTEEVPQEDGSVIEVLRAEPYDGSALY